MRGFTLIELLVVIGVLALLIVAFAPAIGNALGSGERAETVARQQGLVTMIEGYQRYYGAYPPDDFSIVDRSRQKDWDFGQDNGRNTGIESLVMHLSFEPKAGGTLDAHEDWLANTDGDKAPVVIPMLQRQEKMEVVDSWGTPFAYFSGRVGSGYAQNQTILAKAIEGGDDLELLAKPVQNPRSAGPLNPRGFQLISAGPDMVFGTDDDLIHPPLPVED